MIYEYFFGKDYSIKIDNSSNLKIQIASNKENVKDLLEYTKNMIGRQSLLYNNFYDHLILSPENANKNRDVTILPGEDAIHANLLLID